MRKGWANDYVGIPFESKGRSKNGADCWGLVRLVYEDELGIELPDFGELYRSPASYSDIGRGIQSDLFMDLWRPIEKPESGDLIIIRWANNPAHVGIIASETEMLHTLQATDAVIQKFTSRIYLTRIWGFFRHTERNESA